MAKMLSQIATVIRGSVGGACFTANQFAQIVMRAKTSPVNPNTTKQALIRTALADASTRWENLVEASRTGWENYAKTLLYSGPLGTYSVPGRQVFIGNVSLFTYGNTLLAVPVTPDYTPPLVPGFFNPGPITVGVIAAGTGIAIDIGNGTGEDGHALVEISYAFGPSRYRFKGPFLSSSAKFVPLPTGTTAHVEFLTLNEDSIYFVRVRCISTEGPLRISSAQIFRTIAATLP